MGLSQPFGSKHIRSDYMTSDNRYGYNGKEEQTTGDLEYLDYGARMYDATVGRWFGVDPLAEDYYSLSPYNYCANIPTCAIDPDGKLIIFVGGFNPFWLCQQNGKLGIYAPKISRRFSSTDNYGFWGKFDKMYQKVYKDDNAYYTNGGTYETHSPASKRYNNGIEAGRNLLNELRKNKIKLEPGEKIRIVGYSQGAAHAAGLASVILEDDDYKDRVDVVDYILAFQADSKDANDEFENPFEGARQFGKRGDIFGGRDEAINNLSVENLHLVEHGFNHFLLWNPDLYKMMQRVLNTEVQYTNKNK